MKKTNKLLIYTIIISLISTSVFAQDCFVCGGTYFPTGVATLVRNLYNLIKLLVPVVIIIVGMVDLLRAVMASDEKKMEESKSRLIKKLIAGVTIFLLFAIVQFVFKNLLGHNGALSSSMFDCVTYFISEEPSSTACPSRPSGNNANGGSSSGGSNGGSGNGYTCYQCNSDSSKYLWRNSDPGKTTACPAGYHTINKSESECRSAGSDSSYACYQCNSDSSIRLWRNSDPGKTSACGGGYHKTNESESECRSTGKSKKCYECNQSSSIRVWSVSNPGNTSSCPSGFHTINLSESNCK